MDQITARTLRSVEWKQCFSYAGGTGTSRYTLSTYACDALPGVTITKEQRGTMRVRSKTIYQFAGRKTDSPTQLVRYWNEAARAAKSGKADRKPGEPDLARRG